MKVKTLNHKQVEYLKRIGLTADTIELYDLLHDKGPLSAQQAATYTLHYPAAHYRLFYALEQRALVRRLSGRPTTFLALDLKEGLKASLADNEHSLKQLIQTTFDADGGVKIILGRKAVYDLYAQYANEALHEIWIYSIGIAFSEKLEETQRLAMKRGVSIHHIIQQKKLSNHFIITKWLKAGVKLKFLERPRGFHFFVIDRESVCVTFSDPQDTENRFSILTHNKAAVDLFVSYFQDIWLDARQING